MWFLIVWYKFFIVFAIVRGNFFDIYKTQQKKYVFLLVWGGHDSVLGNILQPPSLDGYIYDTITFTVITLVIIYDNILVIRFEP
jgi:hypothetical protein